MVYRSIVLLIFSFTITPVFAENDELPDITMLATALVESVGNEDIAGFSQCWVSAIESVELMDAMAEVEPRLAAQAPSFKDTLEYFKERNKRIAKLYTGIQDAIEEYDLDTDKLSVVFGEIRKDEMGKLVRYQVDQIFELQSEDGWVMKIEVDDVTSFGGAFKFFDSPLHAELTLPGGEVVEVYNSGERGIEWIDEEKER